MPLEHTPRVDAEEPRGALSASSRTLPALLSVAPPNKVMERTVIDKVAYGMPPAAAAHQPR
jgi:hypothetical protein